MMTMFFHFKIFASTLLCLSIVAPTVRCFGMMRTIGISPLASTITSGSTNCICNCICNCNCRSSNSNYRSSNCCCRGSIIISSSSLQLKLNNNDNIQVRDWTLGDEDDIMNILSSAAESSSGFDPEGLLDIDCGSEAALRESYDDTDEDGGSCFIVATDPLNKSLIIGTAALIIGTPITYLQSGASLSSPDKITGAVRRVYAIDDGTTMISHESILQSLLVEIEIRALAAGATDLIILAYSDDRRPNTHLLDKMGYQELPATLKGVDALQYCKLLPPPPTVDNDHESNVIKTAFAPTSNVSSDVAIGSSLVGAVLFLLVGVANMMGLELVPSDDNRGIGTPLSIQELNRLKEDEILKRTDLDGDGDGDGQPLGSGVRQWNDLTFEERREEVALMKIIQGQNGRLK